MHGKVTIPQSVVIKTPPSAYSPSIPDAFAIITTAVIVGIPVISAIASRISALTGKNPRTKNIRSGASSMRTSTIPYSESSFRYFSAEAPQKYRLCRSSPEEMLWRRFSEVLYQEVTVSVLPSASKSFQSKSPLSPD